MIRLYTTNISGKPECTFTLSKDNYDGSLISKNEQGEL